MRRDLVTLDVRHLDADDRLPTVVLTLDGSADLPADRLVSADDERLDGDRIDATFRLQTPVDDDEAGGVFSLSNRVTGEFFLEVNADAGVVLDLVDVARKDADDGGCYRVEIERDDETVAAYEKRTLLVYDDEGSLLRGHSLIPSGVEL